MENFYKSHDALPKFGRNSGVGAETKLYGKNGKMGGSFPKLAISQHQRFTVNPQKSQEWPEPSDCLSQRSVSTVDNNPGLIASLTNIGRKEGKSII